ncbi:helix-turn-helix transcriptional regulator [Thalassolituus maritimus]|uniref:YafY family protein n=1 Tax=Thalassolituus maritimus TaxID=484498 RepID=A0ABP9ZZG5_9GAMM
MPELTAKQSNSVLSYRDQQAYRLIEQVALWEGRITTNTLQDAFGCSRTTASPIIQSYLDACPENLMYCTKSRGYLPTEQFVPRYSTGTLEEYTQLKSPSVSEIPAYPMQMLQRRPDPAIVRAILKAIDQKQRLDISYASFTSPEDGDRIISPHKLVNDGARWHVRAWCEKNQDFRDFVLSRIQAVYGTEGKATADASDDEGWNHKLTVTIEPDMRLTEAQQKLVALDYGMEQTSTGGYQRSYEVRRALLIYTLQNLRLDRPRERGEAQQIMLTPECQRALMPFLP